MQKLYVQAINSMAPIEIRGGPGNIEIAKEYISDILMPLMTTDYHL